MSSAHRPTWDPAKGRADDRHKTARVSSRDMPAHTKLKFRQPATLVDEKKVDFSTSASKAEDKNDSQIEPAETGALESQISSGSEVESESASAIGSSHQQDDKDEDDSDVSNSDESEDEEDDTAALMRELEKIKRERAEERERVERERAIEEVKREEEIALGNPLLNLEGTRTDKRDGASSSRSSIRDASPASAARGYGVKRRWDDDAIFQNQAAGIDAGDQKDFVNDLTRSEFHKKFMHRYVR